MGEGMISSESRVREIRPPGSTNGNWKRLWQGVRHRHRRKPRANSYPSAYRYRASRRLHIRGYGIDKWQILRSSIATRTCPSPSRTSAPMYCVRRDRASYRLPRQWWHGQAPLQWTTPQLLGSNLETDRQMGSASSASRPWGWYGDQYGRHSNRKPNANDNPCT